MTDANVETLRRGYDALNRGDLSEVMDVIADDIAWDPGELAPDGMQGSRGRAGFEEFVRGWMEAFEDFRVEPYGIEERGPHLIAQVRQSGRGRASGAPIEIEIVHVWTVDDGQAVRLQSFRDRRAALDALGGAR